MIVICLEGCHAAGKTELCKAFARANYNVLDEAFLDAPQFALHPQSLTMETIWVANWIERLLKVNHSLKKNGNTGRDAVFVADRSPYSAVFYARRDGQTLSPLVTALIAELAAHDIHIFTVYVSVDREILWSRIQARLAREPSRAQYNEADRLWMERTVQFYESRQWDYVVSNNDDNAVPQVMLTLLKQLGDALTHLSDLDDLREQLSQDAGEQKLLKAASYPKDTIANTVPVA